MIANGEARRVTRKRAVTERDRPHADLHRPRLVLGPRGQDASRAARRRPGTSRWRSRACRAGACASSPATSCAPTRPTTRRSRRPTRTWASRSRCSRPTRRTASRPRPGVNPFQAERDDSTDCASGGVAGPGGQALHGRAADPRPLHRERQLRRPERQVGRQAGPVDERGRHRQLPLRAGRPVDGVDDRHPAGEARHEAALHERSRARGIYHTITSCRFPCLGQTGAAFPLADGQTSEGPRARHRLVRARASARPAISAPKQRAGLVELPVTKEAGLPARRDRDVLLPRAPVHAGRVRGEQVTSSTGSARARG